MNFLPASSLTQEGAAEIGGKAAQLLTLSQMGMPVPRWGVLAVSAYGKPLSEADLTAIRAYFGTKTLLAIRSSAPDEDGSGASFAGQFVSVLAVRPADLVEAIQQVWASAQSERVQSYRAAQGQVGPSGMAVIIQEMIPAEVSGVAFSLDPVSGDRQAQVINAVFGVGEGLVSGELNSDLYRFSEGKWDIQLAEKAFAYHASSETGGLDKVSLSSAQQIAQTLTQVQLGEIRAALLRIQIKKGCPQDIEFAWANQQLYLLQARPVTGLHRFPDRKARSYVWDNSNIVESYPGQTSPLTFAFITRMYAGVYRQLVELLGVQKAEIKAHDAIFQQMLGLIQGRVYYNLRSWYQLLSLLPGYTLNARFMETMMGVSERFELEEYQPKSKWSGYVGVGRMLSRMVLALWRLPRETRSFQAHLAEVLEQYQALELAPMRVEQIIDHYRRLETNLLARWNPPLVNDFFAMIFFGLLQKMATALHIPDAPNVHNDLLCGSADIISTEPITHLLEIASLIQADPAINERFLSQSPAELWHAWESGTFPTLITPLQAYLDRFGDRCIGELKLESLPYQEDPESLIRMIQALVSQRLTSEQAQQGIGQQLRENAEAKVRQALKGKPIKRWVFAWVLRRTRALVSNRENLRFGRTQAFGMVRKLFRAIGKHFWAEGLLQDQEDIFYLKQAEIIDYVEGRGIDTNLQALVDLRKQQYADWLAASPAPRIRTFGMVYHGNSFAAAPQAITEVGDLTGIGCCPGVVRGQVRVVEDPRSLSDLKGDILVCSSTDPGWVPLFPSASALLVARGSLLSHAAIVAREMGKPCVVGISGLLERLKSGDWVELDGSTGQITVLSETEHEAAALVFSPQPSTQQP